MFEGLNSMKKVEGSMQTNQQIYAIEPFPKFDIDKFPYLITKGLKGLSLVSLRCNTMQSLVGFDAHCFRGPRSALFPNPDRKSATDPLKLFFASRRITPDNQHAFCMHKLSLHQDFFDCLSRIGRLPCMTINQVIQLEEHYDKSKEAVAKIAALEEERNKFLDAIGEFEDTK